MATDAEIRARGINFLSPQRYLQNDYQLPTEEVVEETESFGIPQTQAFTNSGGGGGGIQGLDPYNRSQGKPLDPNSFLGKTFTGLKNFGGTVVDKFSGLPGVEQGKGFIRNIMDNTMVGRLAAMRNPLNPNASNYNKNLQGQIDYLSGLSVDGNMMIGRDPNSGLGKYGPDSVLSGQNVVSGFGTNDYGKQLQKYRDKYADTMPKNRLKQLNDEIKSFEEDEEEKYQNRIDSFVKSYSRPNVKGMFEKVYDGNNIHNDPPVTPPPSGGAGQGIDISNAGTQRNEGNNFQGDSGPSNKQEADYGYGSDAGFYARGGRAGYFFGGRVNYKAGGRIGFQGGGRDAGKDSDFGSEDFGGDKDDNREQYGAVGQYSKGPTSTTTNDGNNPPPTFYDNGVQIITDQSKLGFNYPTGLTKNLGIGQLTAILDAKKSLEEEEPEGMIQYDSSVGPFDTRATFDTTTGPEFNANYTGNNFGVGVNSKTGLSGGYSTEIGPGTFTLGGNLRPDGTFDTEAKYGINFANGGLASIL